MALAVKDLGPAGADSGRAYFELSYGKRNGKMDFYISTIAEDAAEAAKEYGFGIEIAEYCTAMNMDELFQEMSEKVEKEIVGVKKRIFHGPFNELFPCAIDPKARKLAAERFLQAAELAHTYGAEKLVLHGGYNPYLYFPSWYKTESIKFWSEFVNCLPEGMIVCVENVLETEPKMMLDIVNAVDDRRLKLCLDIGHVNSYSKVPVLEWLRVCGPAISHFHIHNNDGSYDSHSPLGEGNINTADFLRAADRICPEASFTLEVLTAKSSAVFLKENNLIM